MRGMEYPALSTRPPETVPLQAGVAHLSDTLRRYVLDISRQMRALVREYLSGNHISTANFIEDPSPPTSDLVWRFPFVHPNGR